MDEHRRGVDEADVVRALQRAGAADTGVDVSALAAGARGRARTIRRRRQGMAGVVAVLALGVPIGISQWPSTSPTTITPAVSASPVSSIPDSALLTTADVTAVLAGLEQTDPNPSVNSGFCQVDAYDGTGTVLDSRNLGWGATPSVTSPTPDEAALDVLLFQGGAATDWMALTTQDAQDCSVEGLEGAAWTLADSGVAADEVVSGFRAATLSDSNPSWDAVVVARQGQLVVRVTITTHQPTGPAALEQAAELATAQLDRAAALTQTGGAAR